MLGPMLSLEFKVKKCENVMEMETRPLLKFLLYPGLLTGAVVFVSVHVQSDFQHYKERSTGHSETLVTL